MKIIRTKVNDNFLFVHFDESLRDKMNEFITIKGDFLIKIRRFQLKAFFNEINLGKLAIEEETTNHKIGIKTRKNSVSMVVDYIEETFGIDVEIKMIEMTYGKLIKIFPSLKCAPSEMVDNNILICV